MLVADFQMNGRAMLIVKTADGTIDGRGNRIGTTQIHRNSNGRILTGAEYLTLFCGQTGANLHTIPYNPPIGNLTAWGNGRPPENRVNRFLGAVAYLDGVRPSAVTIRGYYTRMAAVAYDVVNNQLVEKWVFDTGHDSRHPAFGQGNHNVMPAAVHPGDQRQSLFLGASAIRYDGNLLWANGRGHGDAIHVGNFVPGRTQSNGIQVFSCWETSPFGVSLMDALTGQEIWRATAGGDTGRAMAGNFLASSPGAQFWGSNAGGMYNTTGTRLGNQPGSANFAIWWGGSLERQLLDHTGSSSSTMRIDRVTNNNGDRDRIFTTSGVSINGTKGNPCISADLFGDWREELIVRNGNNLRVYVSATSTEHRITTLMHDPQYRMQVAGQNICYNQPPNPSFFLGTGSPLPARPNVTVRPQGGGVNPPVTTPPVTTPVPVAPAISLSPTGTHTFTGATVGYAAAPAAQTFTVTRTAAAATGAMTVALSGTGASAFELSATSLTSIGATSTVTRSFTVRPRTGLAAGTYTATVTVSGTNLTSRTATVSFTVAAAVVTVPPVTTTPPPVITTPPPVITTPPPATTAPPIATTPASVTTVPEQFNGVLFRSVNVLDTPNTGDWSVQYNPRVGQEIFGCQRTFTFASLPNELAAAEWLRVSGNSKDLQTDIAFFSAGADMRLFIGLDSRVTELHELPGWLSGYTLTSMTASTVDGSGNTITFNIYERSFTAGQTVTLGTNGNPFNTMMYTVFALPSAPLTLTTPPTTPPATPPITTVPPIGGTTVPPVEGTTVPPIGGTTVPPIGGTTVPPIGGTTVPPIGGTTVPPIGGTTVPPIGGTTVPPIGGTTVPPVEGTTGGQPDGTTEPPVSTIPNEETIELLMGDVDLNGIITILDALEILMMLAGLDNVITGNPHSMLVGKITDPNAELPGINDALEILMYLAGMESKLAGYPKVTVIRTIL
jgi:hypothetical protein